MSDRSDRHPVLYWNRATPELYAVIREQAPPELEPVFIETEEPAEAREKLARAEFLIIADWALGPADLEGAPRLRMVQHQGVGYERIDTQALAARKIPLCLCPAGTATGVGEHTMTLILAVLKQVVRRAQRPRPGQVAPVDAPAADARPRGEDPRALRVRPDGPRHRPAGARLRGADPRLRPLHHPHARGARPVRRHRAGLARAAPPRVGRRGLPRALDRRDAPHGEPGVPRPDEAVART